MSKFALLKWPSFLFVMLLISVLACGGTDSPELVATVEQRSDTEVTQAPSSTQAQEGSSTTTDDELAGEATTEEVEDSLAESETNVTSGQDTFTVGDVVTIGDSVLVVLGWEEVEGDQIIQPDEGNRFIAVELILVNQGTGATSISTVLQMTVKDSSAQTYNAELFAPTSDGQSGVDGELSPGERVRGKVAFQVPIDAQGLQFVYDESMFGAGRVFVDLGSTPIILEPPTEIAGETEQQIFEIGEVVSIGDSLLTVLGWEELQADDFSQPSEGNKFIAVDLLLVNLSDATASISTLLQTSLKNDAGQTYSPDLLAATLADIAQPDGKLTPGEPVRGKIGFQVPMENSGLLFVFDGDVFDFGKVNVALGAEPSSVEIPTEWAGPYPLSGVPVGETVTIDDLAITVNEASTMASGDFMKPRAGFQYLVVDLTIENLSPEAQPISTLLQMNLKGNAGTTYAVDAFAPGESSVDGELAPGETKRGQVGFQVPLDASNLSFVFDPGPFIDDKAVVTLP